MPRLWSPSLLVVFALAVACGRRQNAANDWSDWTPVPTRFATKFKVWDRGDDHMILVFGHGGERDTVGRYLISSDPSTIGPIDAMVVTKPLRCVAMLSTTHMSYVGALGCVAAVVAGAHLDQVRDDIVRKAIDVGNLQEVATGEGVDRERLLALKLDAVFTYPFGKSEGGFLSGLGIPVVEVSEYLEEHPLGRAEWLRFFGLMLGQKHRADSLFAAIIQRYELVRSRVRRDSMPSVLFGSYWNGQWFVPPGNSYMAKLIDDAGGRYVFADRRGEGNITVDMETMITVGGFADVWGMISALGPVVSDQDFTHGEARLLPFKAVRDRRLFIGNTNSSDLFGKAMIEPDLVLSELAVELHGRKDRDATKQRYYFDDVRFKPE